MREARHGVSNKASNLTAGGGEDPSCTGGIQLQRHTWHQRGRTDRFDVSKYQLCAGRGCILSDTLIVYSETDVSEDEGGRLHERPEMAALLSEEQVIGPSTVAATERGTYTHTHTHSPFPSLISSASLPRSDKGKRVANLSFDEGGFPQTELT